MSERYPDHKCIVIEPISCVKYYDDKTSQTKCLKVKLCLGWYQLWRHIIHHV